MKKLNLNKDTLRRLENHTLKAVRGGFKLTLGMDCKKPIIGDADDLAGG